MDNLETTFKTVARTFTSDGALIDRVWYTITSAHGERTRHYHNLSHLEHLLNELAGVRQHISDWPSIVFAIVFHDVVYNSTSKSNEENSALMAGKLLTEMHVPLQTIGQCKDIIQATKSHFISPNTDINYFTDADLSILGADWDQYEAYTKAIRKEYKFYPAVLYNPGRKKVLTHFLSMSQIYKTTYFFDRYEKSARQNLARELEKLS
ncbi:HD domain-containing protein [Pseudochryseolinea flava]|uniref:Metal-dependent HD superfamily phosphohydrolase n=1 Tax=Pseudochryseolinea flava TaxID=2059302 RepID=A0A364Y7P6_9BACT|nr:hypothetical protein [Pseudochryseolinea flava]RAW03101.1 hypothetical protein DQQ10_03115 [Pseudochryseolinea flava]